MSRMKRSVFKPGYLEEGVYLHLYNHYCGDASMRPFGDAEKEYFLKYLKLTLQLYAIECVSAVVMSNHFHLIVYVPGCPPTAEALIYGIIQLQAKIGRTSTIARKG